MNIKVGDFIGLDRFIDRDNKLGLNEAHNVNTSCTCNVTHTHHLKDDREGLGLECQSSSIASLSGCIIVDYY
jgi:hypothetical protein